jgi:hypothetical protein
MKELLSKATGIQRIGVTPEAAVDAPDPTASFPRDTARV